MNPCEQTLRLLPGGPRRAAGAQNLGVAARVLGPYENEKN